MALTVEFTLAGRQFIGLNGGPQYPAVRAVPQACAGDNSITSSAF